MEDELGKMELPDGGEAGGVREGVARFLNLPKEPCPDQWENYELSP